MQDSPAIACTLTAGDLENRQDAWLKVGTFGQRSMQISGGLAFEFTPATGVYDSLKQLIRLEAECCQWMTFTLDNAPGKVIMTVTAEGDDGETAVRATFTPLVRELPVEHHGGDTE